MTAEIIPLAPRLMSAEFDCTECGQHIIAFAPRVFVCAMCQMIPGWHKDPELVRVLGELPGLAP